MVQRTASVFAVTVWEWSFIDNTSTFRETVFVIITEKEHEAYRSDKVL